MKNVCHSGTVRIQGMTPENLNIKLTEVGGEQLITLEQAIDHENTAICGSLIANYDCQITLFVVDDSSSIPAFVYINVADVNDNDPVVWLSSHSLKMSCIFTQPFRTT